MLTATLAILPHYFNKRLSLANGVMNVITAVVVVVLPISTSWSLENFGLKYTFYYFTVLNFFTALLSFTFKPILKNDKNISKVKKVKNSFGKDIFKKPNFIIWCVASIVCMFGYLIPVVNIVSKRFIPMRIKLKWLHEISKFPTKIFLN